MKTKLRKRILPVAMAALMAWQPLDVAAQGVPVIDISAIVQAILQNENLIEQIVTLKGQWDTAKSTLTGVEEQVKGMTGKRLLGKLLANPATRSALPPNMVEMWDAISTRGKAGLVDYAAQLARNSKRFDCSTIDNPDRRQHCEVITFSPLQQQALAKRSLDVAKADIDEIDGLQDEIDRTDDPKSIAELQARMLISLVRSVNKTQEFQAQQVFGEQQVAEAREAARARLRAQMTKDAPKPLQNFKFTF